MSGVAKHHDRGGMVTTVVTVVTARWKPQDAHKLVLDNAPVFYPTEEEFKDTIKYIATIRQSAEQYGISRITYADEFKRQYFSRSAEFVLGSCQQEPSIDDIEGEYWWIVERPTEEIEVLYGADFDTRVFSSDFPKELSSTKVSTLGDQYMSSGWNLNNFPGLPSSVLSFESGDIYDVLVPWLYVGMCFSSF
ncbi:hypothetical protein ZIOFF_046941 [Zingiber officinale]|uniref:JmjN domain-containing protein n=1 Tax=Zingiber officinale TaxID=94328 RepID=A0A8J5G5G2_ZINOF|nr:hypothetical protein ZIOFF_046941 [Zingiber officinale]